MEEKKMKRFSNLENVVMKIWASAKDDKMTYQTSLYNKTMEKPNLYIDVYFKNTISIPNGSNIFVKDGFWSWYKISNRVPKIIIRINDYDILGEQALENEVFKEMADEELDLPF